MCTCTAYFNYGPFAAEENLFHIRCLHTQQLQEYSRCRDNRRIPIQLHTPPVVEVSRHLGVSGLRLVTRARTTAQNFEFLLRLSCSHVSTARVRSAYPACLHAGCAHSECDLLLMISRGWTAVYTAAAHSECDLDRVKIGPLLCK